MPNPMNLRDEIEIEDSAISRMDVDTGDW